MKKTNFSFLFVPFILFLIVLQIFSTQNIQQKTVVKSIIELNSRVQDTLIQKKEVLINT
ncbi:MAG: hypothetical protein RLZZ292_824, partial [Bacteroidota bacterium]